MILNGWLHGRLRGRLNDHSSTCLASDSSVTVSSQSDCEFSLAEFSGSLSAMAGCCSRTTQHSAELATALNFYTADWASNWSETFIDKLSRVVLKRLLCVDPVLLETKVSKSSSDSDECWRVCNHDDFQSLWPSGLLAFASFTDLHCGLNSNLYHQHWPAIVIAPLPCCHNVFELFALSLLIYTAFVEFQPALCLTVWRLELTIGGIPFGLITLSTFCFFSCPPQRGLL